MIPIQQIWTLRLPSRWGLGLSRAPRAERPRPRLLLPPEGQAGWARLVPALGRPLGEGVIGDGSPGRAPGTL